MPLVLVLEGNTQQIMIIRRSITMIIMQVTVENPVIVFKIRNRKNKIPMPGATEKAISI